MNTPLLNEALLSLKQHREKLTALRGELAERRAAYDAENAELIAQVAAMSEDCANAEEICRQVALDIFSTTGDKRVHPCVTVKEFTVYDYSPAKVFDWAQEHGLCLSLDRKAFEGLCKQDSTRPSFVAVLTEARSQVASDLGKIVDEQGEAENAEEEL